MRGLVAGIFSTGKWRAAGALALMSAVSLTEGATLMLLLPLLALAGVQVEQGSVGRLSELIRTAFMALGLHPTLTAVLLIFVVVTVLQSSLVRLQNILDTKIVQDYSQQLRSELYTAIAQAEWLTLSRVRSSDFTFALTNAVDRVASSAQLLIYSLATGALALAYVAFAMALSPVMSAVVIASGLLLLALQRGRSLDAEIPGQELTESTTELYATAAEQLGGLKTAKSYGQENRHLDIFLETSRRVNRANFDMTRTFSALQWRQTVGSAIALGVVLFIAVNVLRLPSAAILILLFLFTRLVPRMVAVQRAVQHVTSGLPALRVIEGLIDKCRQSPEQNPAHQIPVAVEAIELSDVTFTYGNEGALPALSHVNLTVPAGKTSAVIGASGAGKSTLADLLLGLIRPTEGRILLSGATLDPAHLRSWRSQIGYVAQDTFLFNETVRANLEWAQPGASEPEMWDALRVSSSDEFVVRLSNGLDTVIGERGVRLSGGEKQRLSLARALLRQPRFLILDEATSALDSENEQRIYQAITRLHGEMTILVITHRLSTVRSADIIHVLDRGRLVASGEWDSLMAGDSPRFHELCAAQGIDIPAERAYVFRR